MNTNDDIVTKSANGDKEADPNCPFCLGEGVRDSGGFTMWDTPVFIRCGCTYEPK